MKDNFFRRAVKPCERDSRILIDSGIRNEEYVESFGFEWTMIDGFIGKESMSHGHIFGRFMLQKDFFAGKTIADVGCGNGRIGRLIAPLSENYIGLDLSQSVYAFPGYLMSKNITLVRASGTDLPLVENLSDITLCWGVLHHMDKPMEGLEELIRVTKPGGTILIFIYSKSYRARKNFNQFSKNLNSEKSHRLLESVSDYLDSWREVDAFYANLLSRNLFMSVKNSKEWQLFQWYDGITPQFHWDLEERLEKYFSENSIDVKKTQDGCYRVKKDG
ncbi:class I SAM-dependent methyltransferase [Betaproteobacteria bacterium]|nr:class I SAM-dependent methyltransferase [Betaproteobacteria bacterium]